MKTNLLKETEEILKEHGKTFDDVVWAGIRNEYTVPLEDFKKAIDEEYNNHSGATPNVPKNLVVRGKDFFLKRVFDGLYERWIYIEIPIMPETVCGRSKYDFWRKH